MTRHEILNKWQWKKWKRGKVKERKKTRDMEPAKEADADSTHLKASWVKL